MSPGASRPQNLWCANQSVQNYQGEFCGKQLLGARQLIKPPLVPLTMIVATGLAFLFVVFAYSNASAWIGEDITGNRATLQLAPLLVCLGVLLWSELTAAARVPEPVPVVAVADASAAADA